MTMPSTNEMSKVGDDDVFRTHCKWLKERKEDAVTLLLLVLLICTLGTIGVLGAIEESKKTAQKAEAAFEAACGVLRQAASENQDTAAISKCDAHDAAKETERQEKANAEAKATARVAAERIKAYSK